MHLLHEAYQFEYRDSAGTDQFAEADLWESGGGERAVLVLRGLSARGSRLRASNQSRERAWLLEQAHQAFGKLAHSWLPFVVPCARLSVLVLWPCQPVTADLSRLESEQGLSPDHSHLLVLT